MQTAPANTPGFQFRASIRISTDRAGRKRAHYWSMRGARWFSMEVAKAELFLATGLAATAVDFNAQTIIAAMEVA